ncbi:hypothetical protein DMUE_2009 [Dictyocoela muelleri]|nr:hypothetical protein DMUE_2009 [Dictyocoela muelleri]
MFETFKNYVEIKNLKRMILKICKKGDNCLTNKFYDINKVRTVFATEPFSRDEIIPVDIKGPIKTSHFDTKAIKKETYVLAATDLFSRFTEVRFIKDIHSLTVCRSLEEMWFMKYKNPQK